MDKYVALDNARWTSNEFFRNLTSEDFNALFGELETLYVQRGETLITKGSDADALYFVKSGRFAVRIGDVTIAEIGAGHPIGEIAFFTGSTRTADVVAARDATILKLDREAYRKVIAKAPNLQNTVITALANRLADASRNLPSDPALAKSRTFALLPKHGKPLDYTFVDGLVSALSVSRKTLVLNAEILRGHLPDCDLDSNECVDWLNAREEDHDIVLYVADPTLTSWTQACIRQADQVLFCRWFDEDREVGPLEAAAIAFHPVAHRRLVLLHPERLDFAEGSASWLDSREVFMHHHVCPTDEGDLKRLARFMTDQAIGFVGGGGGAFGSAHVGIYRAMREAGIPFDLCGGTSVGSAMAAAFSFQMHPDEIDRRTAHIFIQSKSLKRPTLPRYAFLDHKPFDQCMEMHYTDLDISDLWIPYFAVATNLSTNRSMIIRRGPLWRAIRASSSIPGVLPPIYTDDGEMLVDGGLTDNLPLEYMHQLKNGPNLVVTFSKPRPHKFNVEYDKLPGRTELVLRTLNPFDRSLPRAPGVASVLMRSMLANQNIETIRNKPSDLLVRPPLTAGASFMNWDLHNKIYNNAYRWMSDRVDELSKEGHAAFSLMEAHRTTLDRYGQHPNGAF